MTEKRGDLGDFIYILLKRRKFLFWNTFIVTVLVMGGSFLLPLRFTATATLLPPKEGAGNGLLGLGSLAERFDLSNIPLTGASSNAQVCLSILRSRTVVDSLITEFHLLDRYKARNMEAARRALGAASNSELASAGLIRISVEDKDPQVAADMANAYVRHLDRINRTLRMSEGKRTRIFIEERLNTNKKLLHSAEDSLLAFKESHPGVVLPEDISASASAAADLMARRITVGADLELLRSSLYSGAPALVQKEREVQALDGELGSLPQLELELGRRFRDFKVQERVFELLTAQFEQAQIQENRDITTVDVLDPAIPPVRKSYPHRGIITVIAFVLSTVVGVVIAISQEALGTLRLREDARLHAVVPAGSLLDRLLFGRGSRSSS